MKFKIVSKEKAIEYGWSKYYTGKPCKRNHLSERDIINDACIRCEDENQNERQEEITANDKEPNFKIVTAKEARQSESLTYYTGKPCVNGHLSERYLSGGGCITCQREYAKKNKDKVSQKKREWDEKNKERVLLMRRLNYEKTKEIRFEKVRAKNLSNPLIKFTRSTLRRVLEVRAKDIENALPYDNAEFMKHIESKFQDGMNWHNRGDWHIDHIKPLSYFTKKGIYDINIINALSNLQPLWQADNLKKYSKVARKS